MYGLSFLSLNTVTLTLFLMITYEGTYSRERIVLEEHVSRIPEFPFSHESDHVRDRGGYWTARNAHRFLAEEASLCFSYDM